MLSNPLSLLHQFGFLQSTNWSLSACPPLTNKVAVITGGAGGIGGEIARQLLLHDIGTVIVLARSRARFDAACADVWGPELATRVQFVELDLADLRAVERVGAELAGSLERLDMLFLNAATGLSSQYTLSPQGVEAAFATNHLGHHHLTQLLLPLLCATPSTHNVVSTRIVVTSSSLHTLCRRVDFDAITAPTGTASPFAAVYRYARSKLANILFTRALSQRLPANVIANVYFPGNVPTGAMDAWKGVAGPLGGMVSAVFKRVGQSLEDGAATAVFLGAAEEVEKGEYRGEYWVPVAKIEECSAVAMDGALGERLWAWSEEMGRTVKGETGRADVPAVVESDTAGHVHLAHPTCLTPAQM